jgi:hypothetical protein
MLRHAKTASSRLRPLLQLDAGALRVLAVALLAVQLAGSIAAAATDVMLHGDGSYFVYSLSAGEPWMLKWRDIATRATAYVTTVLPTALAALLLDLTPLEIGRLNGFIFYFIQALQFAIACALVWRSHPQYLIFPTAQYAFSTILGFGFPSEILLAPGFLWIALFLALKGRAVSIWFAICFVALVFSHELALPAALVAGYAGWRQARRRDCEAGRWWGRSFILLLILGAIAALWAVRISGGAGTDHTAIYVFDPRRVLNNPTLHLMIAALFLYVLWMWRHPGPERLGTATTALLLAVAVAAPLVLRAFIPELNFSQGRYDSARTFTGGLMVVLASCFVLLLENPVSTKAPGPPLWAKHMPLAIAVAAAIAVGSGAAFLYDWTLALRGWNRVVVTSQSTQSVQIIPYAQARRLMQPHEARINDRIGFHWVLPYRSVVLADGGNPSRIVFADFDYRDYCAKSPWIDRRHSKIPAAVLSRMRSFACTHQPPPPIDTISRRFSAYIARVRARLFGSDDQRN